MIKMQRFLMLVSSMSASIILQHVHLGVSLLSLALNFANRHHDLGNTMAIALAFTFWRQ